MDLFEMDLTAKLPLYNLPSKKEMKECIECSKTKQILKRSNMEPDMNRIIEESDRQIALDRIRREKYLENYNKKWSSIKNITSDIVNK